MERDIRACECCGKPMDKGFVLRSCTHACCESCAIALYKGDRDTFEAELNSMESETYYTEWENIYLD